MSFVVGVRNMLFGIVAYTKWLIIKIDPCSLSIPSTAHSIKISRNSKFFLEVRWSKGKYLGLWGKLSGGDFHLPQNACPCLLLALYPNSGVATFPTPRSPSGRRVSPADIFLVLPGLRAGDVKTASFTKKRLPGRAANRVTGLSGTSQPRAGVRSKVLCLAFITGRIDLLYQENFLDVCAPFSAVSYLSKPVSQKVYLLPLLLLLQQTSATCYSVLHLWWWQGCPLLFWSILILRYVPGPQQ